jgi:hypothetical protein
MLEENNHRNPENYTEYIENGQWPDAPEGEKEDEEEMCQQSERKNGGTYAVKSFFASG